MEATPTIDQNLYSRQIGTFGLETMGKLIKLKVLIVGMRGLGVETAKNLILAGPAQVDLYDPTVVRVNDLGSNFYARDEHIGKVSRAQASQDELRELNPYVKVNVIDSLSMDDHKNYNVVCYTENLTNLANLMEVNALCRQNNIGFILTETLGLLGYAFVDYGENHKIFDHNGENTKSFMVVSVSCEEKATVMVHEDKRHSYEEGDYVSFTEIEGLKPEINGCQPIKIINVKGPYSFQIDLDTRNWPAYKRQGLVENVKVPRFSKFHSLAHSYLRPVDGSPDGMLATPDMRNWGRSDHLHIALRAVHAFHQQNGRYPEFDDADAVSTLAKAINEEAKNKEQHFCDELDDMCVRMSAKFASCSLVPQCAFFGGIVA